MTPDQSDPCGPACTCNLTNIIQFDRVTGVCLACQTRKPCSRLDLIRTTDFTYWVCKSEADCHRPPLYPDAPVAPATIHPFPTKAAP